MDLATSTEEALISACKEGDIEAVSRLVTEENVNCVIESRKESSLNIFAVHSLCLSVFLSLLLFKELHGLNILMSHILKL